MRTILFNPRCKSALWLSSVALGLLLTCEGRAATKAERREKEREALSESTRETLELFRKTDPDLAKVIEKSAGYVVFPKISKGAAGVGAAHGTGQVFDKGKLVGEAKVTQVTIGLQLGGQVYSELILFETTEALKSFQEGDFKFSAQVSAVAAAEGASKNAKYELGVLVFTMARAGLMYEASIGGQKFGYAPYAK